MHAPPDHVYDPSPRKPLDASMFDPDRYRALIELGLTTHGERARVDRWLRAGAEFTAYEPADGQAIITLEITKRSPELAAIRARVWGGEVELLHTSEYGECIQIAAAPLSVLRRVNRG
jgi:hypothetical protein